MAVYVWNALRVHDASRNMRSIIMLLVLYAVFVVYHIDYL